MSPIPFTDREMINAWKENFKASQINNKSNSHRLLLFYSVECGLKAILMRRQSLRCTNECEDIYKAQHNINHLLDCLKAGKSLSLNQNFLMSEIKIGGKLHPRKLSTGMLNQVWRYGGSLCNGETDISLEKNLLRIHEWIKQELS
jgi:hypothetical protein